MDELEYYSPDEIEDMELQDWEVLGKSDFELIEELASINAINDHKMDPHLDADKRATLRKPKEEGFFWTMTGNAWLVAPAIVLIAIGANLVGQKAPKGCLQDRMACG